MKIAPYNFTALHDEQYRREYLSRVEEILKNNSFIEGPYNESFEKEFANAHGVSHCLLVANGTDALEISLKVLGVQPGDLVGVPGITFYATAEAVLNIGAKPVLIDIDEATGLMCLNSLKEVHQNHPLKAIIPVHIYGLPVSMEGINSFCSSEKIAVIEDAAQAHGALYPYNKKPVGHGNNLTTFSFYPTKNLSAHGDAGCILTNDDELARKIIIERNHGRTDEQALGRNSRCDHMQAAALHLKLKNVDKYNQRRKELAKRYHQNLKELSISLIPDEYLELSSWHLYPVQLETSEKRVELAHFLKERGIGSMPFYEKSLQQEPPLAHFPGQYEKANAMAGKRLCLPLHPFLSDEEVDEVSAVVKEFLNL